MGNDFLSPLTTFGEKLRFTPSAWAKLLYMRDKGQTEVAGYGVTGTEDPLLITDFFLVKQECSMADFDLDTDDVAKFMDNMLEAGLAPWQCSNILLHTHPGNCATPSHTDEANFLEAFSHPNWAIMFIIANGGNVSCRLKINSAPGVTKELPVCIDWQAPFDASDTAAWEIEYDVNVTKAKQTISCLIGGKGGVGVHNPPYNFPSDEYEPLWRNPTTGKFEAFDWIKEKVEQKEEEVVDEFTEEDVNTLDCYWDRDGCVCYWDEPTDGWYMYDPESETWFWSDEPQDGEDVAICGRPTEQFALLIPLWAKKFANEKQLIVEE